QAGSTRLAAAVCLSDLLAGNFYRSGAFPRHLLSRGQLASAGADFRPRQQRADDAANPASETDAWLATASQIPGTARRMKRPRLDVNLEELDQIIDRGTHAPLSESEGEKLKLVLHALAGMLPQPRSTEKTSAVLPPTDPPTQQSPEKPKGHGRNGASSYTGARKVAVPHPTLH